MSTNNVTLLKSFINYCSDKGKVLNQNIANVNSPDYQRRDVDFSAYLNSETQSTATNKSGHLTGGGTMPTGNDKIFVDDSNVDIESEMAELAKNTMNFKFASKRIGNYYKNLQTIIKSGG